MKYLITIIIYFLFIQINYSKPECTNYKNLSLKDSKGRYLDEFDGGITSISVCFDKFHPGGIGFVLIDYNGNFSGFPYEITRLSNFGGDNKEVFFTFPLMDMRMKLIINNKMKLISLENIQLDSYKLYSILSAAEIEAQRREMIAIDNEKIEKYKLTSQDLSSTDKLEQLDKLISSLNNKYPELENERKEVIEGIFNEGIEKSLKNCNIPILSLYF